MSSENKCDVSSTEPAALAEHVQASSSCGSVVVHDQCACAFSYDNKDFYSDCSKFTELYEEKTGKVSDGKINRKFITQMVMDELDELNRATDLAEEVDALLDAVYYIFQHLSTTGIDIRPVWQEIHKANMTKFEKGHKRQDGKWMKPADFVPPDNKIREIIADQQRGINPHLQRWLFDDTVTAPIKFRWRRALEPTPNNPYGISFCQQCFDQIKAYISMRKTKDIYPYVTIEDNVVTQCFSKTPVDDEQWLDDVMEAAVNFSKQQRPDLFD